MLATLTATKTPVRIARLAPEGHKRCEYSPFTLARKGVGASRSMRGCPKVNRFPQDEQNESLGFTETPQ
jgi:hypothetical protein